MISEALGCLDEVVKNLLFLILICFLHPLMHQISQEVENLLVKKVEIFIKYDQLVTTIITKHITSMGNFCCELWGLQII